MLWRMQKNAQTTDHECPGHSPAAACLEQWGKDWPKAPKHGYLRARKSTLINAMLRQCHAYAKQTLLTQTTEQLAFSTGGQMMVVRSHDNQTLSAWWVYRNSLPMVLLWRALCTGAPLQQNRIRQIYYNC